MPLRAGWALPCPRAFPSRRDCPVSLHGLCTCRERTSVCTLPSGSRLQSQSLVAVPSRQLLRTWSRVCEAAMRGARQAAPLLAALLLVTLPLGRSAPAGAAARELLLSVEPNGTQASIPLDPAANPVVTDYALDEPPVVGAHTNGESKACTCEQTQAEADVCSFKCAAPTVRACLCALSLSRQCRHAQQWGGTLRVCTSHCGAATPCS